MTWDLSRISGPWPVNGGVVFVIPAAQVTADLQAYASDVPEGVPVLAGVVSKALSFADEAAAAQALGAFRV